MKLYAPSTIREIREKYGFRLTKSLGQNFLTDKNIIDDIIDGAAIGAQDLVIEIGPGIGVLTWEAAQLAQKVIAVEIDKNLIPILAETLREADNIEVIKPGYPQNGYQYSDRARKGRGGSRRQAVCACAHHRQSARTISPHRSS